MSLLKYIAIGDAIELLLHPLVEIVIHDIDSDKIIYINGSLSHRRVGDQSLLDKNDLETVDQMVYSKINFDGRLVKSISVVLEEKWLLCINCDVSVFSKMRELSCAILGNKRTQPKALFINDWQEKLHMSIHEYFQKHHLSFEHLTHTEKKSLVKHLFELGAFHEKKAADYVAKVLRLGRATIFKYLKEIRI